MTAGVVVRDGAATTCTGDVMRLNNVERLSESTPAVHVEADRSLGDNLVNSSVLNPTSTGQPQSRYHQYASEVQHSAYGDYCVYATLLGQYEELNELSAALVSGIPFTCLTDDPKLRSATWQIRLVDPALGSVPPSGGI